MTRDQLRATIAEAVGNPTSGTVHDVIDTITDAILEAEKTPAPKEKRVTEPTETR